MVLLYGEARSTYVVQKRLWGSSSPTAPGMQLPHPQEDHQEENDLSG